MSIKILITSSSNPKKILRNLTKFRFFTHTHTHININCGSPPNACRAAQQHGLGAITTPGSLAVMLLQNDKKKRKVWLVGGFNPSEKYDALGIGIPQIWGKYGKLDDGWPESERAYTNSICYVVWDLQTTQTYMNMRLRMLFDIMCRCWLCEDAKIRRCRWRSKTW